MVRPIGVSAQTESLEPRLLLSVSLSDPVDLSDPGSPDNALWEQTAIVTARAPARNVDTLDANDHYLYKGQQVEVLRIANELALSFEHDTDRQALEYALHISGLLSSAEPIIQLDNSTFVYSVTLEYGSDAESFRTQLGDLEGIAWVGPSFASPATGQRMWVTNEVAIALADGVDAGVFFADSVFSGYYQLFMNRWVATVVGDSLDAMALVNVLDGSQQVEWAVPNMIREIEFATNDPLYGDQWHLTNTGQSGGTQDADVDASDAWIETTGDEDIVIAVLDNGVQINHPDLQANVFVNLAELNGTPGFDDDGNGMDDDITGWDFVNWGNDPNPDTQFDNHGTAVAGVAVAVGDNNLGVAGVAYHTQVLPIKVARAFLNPDQSVNDGFVNDAILAQAVYYAAGIDATGQQVWRGADILNLSWGVTGGTAASLPLLANALDDIAVFGRNGLGTVVFAASGNRASGYVDVTIPQAPGAFAGQWSWAISYDKDASASAGEDTIRLGMFVNSDGSVSRFDSATPPAGWDLSPFAGQVAWTIEEDPTRSYGTGQYQARPVATIGHNQEAFIMTPAFTLAPGQTVIPAATASIWRSCEVNDIIRFRLWNHDTQQLFDWATLAGADPTITPQTAFPANHASTIAVGASTDFDYRSDFSCYGAALDFVAPGGGGFVDIWTTDRTGTNGYNTEQTANGGDYIAIEGTSFASPLAAGIGALLLSKNPDLTLAQVRALMQDSCDQVGNVAYTNGRNDFYGHGRLNAAAALDAITDAPTEVVLVSDTGVPHDNITKLDNHNAASRLEFEVSGTIVGATVTLYDGDGTEIGSGISTGGPVTIETEGDHDLADGVHGVYATQVIAGKLESAPTTALNVTIDTQAPAVSAPDLIDDDDTGQFNDDNITKGVDPTFTGTASDAASGLWKVVVDSNEATPQSVETTSFPASTYTVDLATLVEAAAFGRIVTATAYDVAGNSTSSSALAMTIDRSAPAVSVPDLIDDDDTGQFNDDNITKGVDPTFTGTASDAASGLWKVVVDSNEATPQSVETTSFPASTYTVDLATLVEAAAFGRTVTATAYDVAGNSAASSALAMTVDRTDPERVGDPVINNGATQRDTIEVISYTFDGAVLIDVDDLLLYYHDETNWSQPLTLTEVGFNYNPATYTATWSDLPIVGARGHYVAQLDFNAITDIAGNTLIRDLDVPGTDDYHRFHVLAGDIDGNASQDSKDIDLLFDQIFAANPDFDLNNDGLTNHEDMDVLIIDILDTFYGDMDLDGNVDLDDFVLLKQNFGIGSTWAEGDMDGDGNVDLDDFVILKKSFGSDNPDFELDALGAVPAWV